MGCQKNVGIGEKISCAGGTIEKNGDENEREFSQCNFNSCVSGEKMRIFFSCGFFFCIHSIYSPLG